ncbi:MAG: hypothetical protein JWP34_1395 [Massilia sp.]|jgi:uncharacterized DUF497 family protein|nr:hypothetical protein [Massilia sp.]
MRIEFDPLKDLTNQAKHGVSLAVAGELDWQAALIRIDDRIDYNEQRRIGLVPHGGRLYCVAFVDRSTVRRIISLRRANRREAKYYVENFQTP